MQNKPIPPRRTVVKTIIFNRIDNEFGEEETECELTFNDETKIRYKCKVEQLQNEWVGVYELLENGNYELIEEW